MITLKNGRNSISLSNSTWIEYRIIAAEHFILKNYKRNPHPVRVTEDEALEFATALEKNLPLIPDTNEFFIKLTKIRWDDSTATAASIHESFPDLFKKKKLEKRLKSLKNENDYVDFIEELEFSFFLYTTMGGWRKAFLKRVIAFCKSRSFYIISKAESNHSNHNTVEYQNRSTETSLQFAVPALCS